MKNSFMCENWNENLNFIFQSFRNNHESFKNINKKPDKNLRNPIANTDKISLLLEKWGEKTAVRVSLVNTHLNTHQKALQKLNLSKKILKLPNHLIRAVIDFFLIVFAFYVIPLFFVKLSGMKK